MPRPIAKRDQPGGGPSTVPADDMPLQKDGMRSRDDGERRASLFPEDTPTQRRMAISDVQANNGGRKDDNVRSMNGGHRSKSRNARVSVAMDKCIR